MDQSTAPSNAPSPAEPAAAVLLRKFRELDRERVAVALLLLAGALLRLWYLWSYAGSPLYDLTLGPDVGEYAQRAREIAGGIFWPLSPDIHAPCYPYFLALLIKLGSGVPAVRIVQLALNFGAWFAIYRLLAAKRTPVGIRVAFLAVAMVLPVPFFYQAELVSEALLVPWAAAFLWLRHLAAVSATRRRRAGALFGAGLVLGAMNLTHPLTLVFSAAEVGWELFCREFRRAALLAAALLVTVGTFCAVQSFHYRKFCGIQANTGFNLYLGNHSGASGGCYLRPGRSWRKVHRDAEQEAKKRGISADKVFLRRAGSFWLRQPGKALLLAGRKACMVLSPRELPSGSDLPPLIYFTTVVFYGRFLTPALLLLAAFGLWRIFRTRGIRYIHWLLLFFSLYLAQVLTVTSGRYRMLMTVPAALFAAVGICGFDWRRRWWILLLAVLGCGFFTATDYGRSRSEAALLYAEAALRKDDFRQAEALAAYAFRAVDDPDPALCCELRGIAAENLSRIALEQGRYPEAQRQLDLAGRFYLQMRDAEPTYFRGWMHLAFLAEKTGRDYRAAGRTADADEWYRQAEKWYLKALELEPAAPELCYNYALFRFDTGRPCAESVTAALRAAPADPRVWNLAGIVAQRDGELRRALDCFYRAMELSPDQATRDKYLNNLRNVEHRLKTSK